MRARVLVVLLVAAVVAAGCSTAAELKARKDGSWEWFPRALPDTHDPNPNGYGHPLRGLAFVLHPIGVALDYVLVRPFYMVSGLGPEWWGLTVEDVQRFHSHQWELLTPQNAPRRFE